MTQGIDGASFKLKLRPERDWVSGSSFWAVCAKPAASSRLEIVPSAMRFNVFIGSQSILP